ncbi:hypothetical protein CINS5915_01980 [Campylobacter insulaenigrae]|uniref:hypothetical protein n=1 Tax=Campylobacter insulaenigrae TaxID=260714 RepID=UPI0021522FE0|nr:hypothetical protein [Campylobacter insulaenigrae]MCR6574104.1 hypothetical protein [Campylobacter insulaenigrae]MCR6575141.1 hypothetical protein [Campylobacter insulaenigrae]MCR6580053.1 hypothetical protein [Campylobacter insulaenigrae]MCR6586048.1 hypothetical protein [Campylobacter insulaenigrae]
MNCINHNDVVSVSMCNHCNVGLCAECVNKFIKTDNKPLCKSCSILYIDNALDELNVSAKKNKTKKIIWTIILVFGVMVYFMDIFHVGENNILLRLIPTFFIWGLAGFFERFKRDQENETFRTALYKHEAYKNGSFMFDWIFRFCFAIIRGVFFPIFYILFMVNSDKNIKKDLEYVQGLKEGL